MPEILRRSPLLLHVRLLWHVAPRLSAGCLALAVLQSAAAVIAMISSGQVIGALSEAAAGADTAADVWRWTAATLAALLAGPLLASVSRGIEELINARYLGGYQDLLLDTAIAPDTVDRLHTEDGASALERAAEALQHWLFLRGVGGIWGVISNRLAGVGALVIVIGWRWWIAIALLLCWLVLSRAIARWRSIVFDDTEQRAVPLRHRAAYLQRLLAGRESAKEIRLFGLADWLLGGYQELSRTAMQMVAGRRGEGVRRTAVPMVLLLLLHAGAFAMVIIDVSADRVSVALLATVVQAILGLSAFGRQDDDETSTGRTAAELSRLVTLRDSLQLPFPAPPPQQPGQSGRGNRPATVEIQGLTFCYPGSSTPVLDGIDLRVEAGSCVAVVGANGTGKSTLLGLLCGLWQPDAGTIRIDGRDVHADPAVRGRIAPIFQTFLRLPLTATENITAGNAWRPDTGWQEAAEAAGADAVIDGLPAGAATVLSSEHAGGVDLSGGQWQRVALARALVAVHAGAGVLALDEPTAALDVRAEVALFESVLGLRHRSTTLLITHRLSSVRHADTIVVLGRPRPGAGARVIESGTHEELMRHGGSYAQMFTLQAAAFTGAAR